MVVKNPTSSLPVSAELQSTISESRWLLLLALVSLVILLSGLGSAALFDPDEGRNAEKARELLLLNDFVTPHQNFLPTLDKPMPFYWLIAAAFKLFGASEAPARLPSVLAAIGSLVLVYQFARHRRGLWAALWSCLVLVTGLQFFIFSRLVMPDMTLTFFITGALLAFYSIAENSAERPKISRAISLYAAIAMGTLIKGPVALIVPALVIFCFLLVTGNWVVLKRLHILIGVAVCLAIVTPWYVWVEVRNPGYLRYFLWDEHLLRYSTTRFGRSNPWYYFLVVIGLGFLPWSLLLPVIVKRLWQKTLDHIDLFLVLWVILPLVLFSASNSKLPHYILPIYPALAILVGEVISERLKARAGRLAIVEIAPWSFTLGMIIYLCAGMALPQLLAQRIRSAVLANVASILAAALILVLLFAVLIAGQKKLSWRDRGFSYLCTAIGLALFVVLSGQIIATSSFNRASKTLVQRSAPFIGAQDQIVFFDTYLEGVAFYLQVEKPIWLAQAAERHSIMASNYLAARRPAPAAGYGPVVLSYEEFAMRWKSGNQSLRVIVKEKNLPRLMREVGSPAAKPLAFFDEYLLVANR
jgi:4-amino-4-deoxy-L-arabinose transferase-like glycosyltransferase